MNSLFCPSRRFLPWFAACAAWSLGPAVAATVSLDPDHNAVVVVVQSNIIKLQPWSPGTIRVEAAPGTTIPDKKSFAVVENPNAEGWTESEDTNKVTLKGPRLSAEIDKTSGLVSFFDASGRLLLKQASWDFVPAKDAKRDGLNITATFERPEGEHFYGGGVLGDDLRKPEAEIALANVNTQIRIPVLYSSRGYGFFWDNASRGKLRIKSDSITWNASAGDLADFYVFAGPTADAAISEYRHLTGSAPLFPRWAYGFWFSKNRFINQQEILAAAQAFRQHQFPIDLIVQDYFYWKPDHSPHIWSGWGSHQFVPERYPDPKAMIAQLHDTDHVHFMAVIWPRFDEETDHAKELAAVHALFPHASNPNWDPGSNFYDPFLPAAREIYGRQVMDSLLTLGVDAFWMDGAEPEMPVDLFASFDSTTGPMSRVLDAYPLLHTTAVYTAMRKATDQKRVVLLPRSAWAGEQRNAASNWTGDIHQDWKALTWQIEGLQNYSIAGLPYITTDVGGYSPTPEADRELFVRWCEWGAFCPIFRVHGIDRPFPWQYGDEAEGILKKFTELRYRLLPYLYTQASIVTRKDGTLLRPLVMDFQDDPQALTTWDEFLFGPSLLVCPVHSSSRTSAATPVQWADATGKAGGVTVSFDGGEPIRKDLGDEFDFQGRLTQEQNKAKSIMIEGTFTPNETGNLNLVVCAVGMANPTATVKIDGQEVTTSGASGDWIFPAFSFTAKSGVPVHISATVNNPHGALRIVHPSSGTPSRDVYLPGDGDWYDFWTGERHVHGPLPDVATPLDRIPLYVRAGSILPFGPELQYADEKKPDPIELRIYPGASGNFTLYEDEGDNYDYEKGAFAEIPMTWDDSSKTLTIGARQGSFPGMLASRTFRVIWVKAGHGIGESPSDVSDHDISYSGQAVSVTEPK